MLFVHSGTHIILEETDYLRLFVDSGPHTQPSSSGTEDFTSRHPLQWHRFHLIEDHDSIQNLQDAAVASPELFSLVKIYDDGSKWPSIPPCRHKLLIKVASGPSSASFTPAEEDPACQSLPVNNTTDLSIDEQLTSVISSAESLRNPMQLASAKLCSQRPLQIKQHVPLEFDETVSPVACPPPEYQSRNAQLLAPAKKALKRSRNALELEDLEKNLGSVSEDEASMPRVCGWADEAGYICGTLLNNIDGVRDHYITSHSTLQERTFCRCIGGDCEFGPGKKSLAREELPLHVASAHYGFGFKCSCCDRAFPYKDDRNAHLKSAHLGFTSESDPKFVRADRNKRPRLF